MYTDEELKKLKAMLAALGLHVSMPSEQRRYSEEGHGGDAVISGGLPEKGRDGAREGRIVLRRQNDGKAVAFNFEALAFEPIDYPS